MTTQTKNAPGGNAVALTGAELVAHAMRQTDPDVVACYPITPQTVITEAFSEFVASGQVKTEFVPVESEHAAMSACIGASAAGARAQTATSGPGLALMWEVLWVASGNRLPIVMHLTTRSFSAPINILCDHSDAMGMRETGWVMLFAEGAQEAYDNGIMAVRIAEHEKVRLPVASLLDGFIITHTVERAQMLPDDVVAKFVGVYKPLNALLNTKEPMTMGAIDFHDYYYEHKRQQIEAMDNSLEVVRQVSKEYAKLSGREYGLIDTYKMEDAEVAAVIVGSSAGTVRAMADELRREGVKAGVLRIRCFRPFPVDEVAQALSRVKAVAMLERAVAFGAPVLPLTQDVAAVLQAKGLHPKMSAFVYGLGGRDTAPALFKGAVQSALRGPGDPTKVTYLGLHSS